MPAPAGAKRSPTWGPVERELSQDLPPSDSEAAAAQVTEDMVYGQVACGPVPERPVKAIEKYQRPASTKIYINQIGPERDGFCDFSAKELCRAWPPDKAEAELGFRARSVRSRWPFIRS